MKRYDYTNTIRKQDQRARLKADGGFQLSPINLDAEHGSKLDALVSAGFAPSRAEAVRRMIRETIFENPE